MTAATFEFPFGPIPEDDELLACPNECEDGRVFVLISVDCDEPRVCGTCEGYSRIQEIECQGCGAWLAPTINGVGLIERRTRSSSALCGPCAHEEVMAED